jgi:hypothetical protein
LYLLISFISHGWVDVAHVLLVHPKVHILFFPLCVKVSIVEFMLLLVSWWWAKLMWVAKYYWGRIECRLLKLCIDKHVNVFMDASFAAVKWDINLFQVKLRSLQSKIVTKRQLCLLLNMLASLLPNNVKFCCKFCSFFAYFGLSRIMYDWCKMSKWRIGNIIVLMRLGFFFY